MVHTQLTTPRLKSKRPFHSGLDLSTGSLGLDLGPHNARVRNKLSLSNFFLNNNWIDTIQGQSTKCTPPPRCLSTKPRMVAESSVSSLSLITFNLLVAICSVLPLSPNFQRFPRKSRENGAAIILRPRSVKTLNPALISPVKNLEQ